MDFSVAVFKLLSTWGSICSSHASLSSEFKLQILPLVLCNLNTNTSKSKYMYITVLPIYYINFSCSLTHIVRKNLTKNVYRIRIITLLTHLELTMHHVEIWILNAFFGKSPLFGQYSWIQHANLYKIWIECAPKSHLRN